jgi:hypothetical protein
MKGSVTRILGDDNSDHCTFILTAHHMIRTEEQFNRKMNCDS